MRDCLDELTWSKPQPHPLHTRLDAVDPMRACLDALTWSKPHPLHTRIDAIDHLQALIAESGGWVEWAAAVETFRTVVPTLLVAPEELGDSLVELLDVLLDATPRVSEAKVLLLKLAEDAVMEASVSGAWSTFAFISLLSILMSGDAAGAAANALCERSVLLDALMRCMENGTQAAVGTANIENGDSELSAKLAAKVFSLFLVAHGTAPSAILARCDLPLARLLAPLLRRSSAQPSAELLELLMTLATDPILASAIGTAPVIGALKPVLLSQLPALQLAAVELLAVLHDTVDGGDRLLAEENIDGFLLELCRNVSARRLQSSRAAAKTSDQAAKEGVDEAAQEQATTQELARAVRRLLLALVRGERRHGGLLCSRLLDALQPGGSQYAAAASTSSIMEDIEGVAAMLRWYHPTVPHETTRLAQFCAEVIPRLFHAAGEASASGSGAHRHASREHELPMSEVVVLHEALHLVSLAFERCAVDPHASELLVRGCCQSVIFHALRSNVLRLHMASDPKLCMLHACDVSHGEPRSSGRDPGWNNNDRVETIKLLQRLLRCMLQSPLPSPMMKSVLSDITPLCIAVLRCSVFAKAAASAHQPLALTCQMAVDGSHDGWFGSPECSQPALDLQDEPSPRSDSMHALVEPSSLATLLLVVSDRIPRTLIAAPFPVTLDECAVSLLAFTDAGADVMKVLPLLEWILLLLHMSSPDLSSIEHSESADAYPADGGSDPRQASREALLALEQFTISREDSLGSLPAATLRRVATVLIGDHTFAASEQALKAVWRALLSLPPEEVLALPCACIRWLWRNDTFDVEASALLCDWAMLRSASNERQPAAVSLPAAAQVRANPPDAPSESPHGMALDDEQSRWLHTLPSLCQDANAARLFDRLFSMQMPAMRTRHPNAMLATLSLVAACLAGDANMGSKCGAARTADTACELAPSTLTAAQTFADAGLTATLGRLLLLLSSDEDREQRLVLQLLTALLLATPSGASREISMALATDVLAALHHTVGAVLAAVPPAVCHLGTCAPDSCLPAQPTPLCAQLCFVNTVLALHREAGPVLGSNVDLVVAIARLLSPEATEMAVRPGADLRAHSSPSDAAALFFVMLLQQLPKQQQPSALVGTLQDCLSVDSLLQLLRAPSALTRALTLRLIAELIRARAMPPETAPQVGSGTGEEGGWCTSVVCALLNSTVSRELPLLCAAASCVDALGGSPGFETLAAHPWHAFALEMLSLHRPQLTEAHCFYWGAVLETKAPWTVAFFARKTAAAEHLLLHLLHAAQFSPHHLRMWRAVLSLFTPRGASASKLLDLTQLRVREPSASRWHVKENGLDAEVGLASQSTPSHFAGFTHVNGLIVPTDLLLQVPPASPPAALGSTKTTTPTAPAAAGGSWNNEESQRLVVALDVLRGRKK